MEDGSLVIPIYLPEDFRAPFVDPVTATGPAVREIISKPRKYAGETLPIVGDVVSPREMVRVFQDVTGLQAEYRDAFTYDGLARNFPELVADDLHAQEILGMVNYAAEYGYFRQDRDLEWSRSIDPEALTWEQFLRATGWRGEDRSYGL